MNNYRLYLKRFYKEIAIKENFKMILTISFLSIIKIIVVLIPPIFTMKILDEAIPNSNFYKLGLFAFIVLLFTMVESILKYYLSLIYSRFSKKVYLDFQKRCIHHLFKLSGDYYSNMSNGDVFTTLYQDVGQIKGLVSATIFDFISDVIIAFCMFFFLLYIQWDLLLVIALILPTIYFTQRHFQKRGKEKAILIRQSFGSLTGILEGIVSNISPFIFSNAKTYFSRKYDNIVNNATENEIDIQLIYSKNSGVLNFLAALLNIVVLGYGGAKVIIHSLTIGGLMTFNMYSSKLVMPLLKVSNVLMELQSKIVSLEKVYNFLELPTILNSEGNNTNGIKDDGNEICFRDITFGYNDSMTVLEKATFIFRPNLVNVIVGESGCGKSTILSLLYRCWDFESGSIEINGKNIREYDIEYLRKNITIISQDMYLFDDTIFNNINLEQSKSQEEVEKVAKMACIHDYIMSLPKGYDNEIGEKGARLSGGERQRICLARALIRDTPILILDEATSALDQLIEKKVLNNIMNSINNKTIIIITHRLQSITDADSIYVLNNGQIIAQGKHEELMMTNAYYYKLFERNIVN